MEAKPNYNATVPAILPNHDNKSEKLPSTQDGDLGNYRLEGGVTVLPRRQCYDIGQKVALGDVKIRQRRLPHLEISNGIYFITFRLADSIPQSVLREIEIERQNFLAKIKKLNRELTPAESLRANELFSDRIELFLDKGIGSCHLANPEIAEVVAKALQHFNGKRYQLNAWCIMPNHVHVIVRLFPEQNLAKTLHSWKSFTANIINKILRTQGQFWQREYYDRLIRDEAEFYRLVQYVTDNPAKANLPDWQWVELCNWEDPNTIP